MANSAQAKKRARQAEKHRVHNVHFRTTFRSVIKNVIVAIEANDIEEANKAYKLAVPVIDSTARKGLIHTNKAARHKARLNQQVKAIKA